MIRTPRALIGWRSLDENESTSDVFVCRSPGAARSVSEPRGGLPDRGVEYTPLPALTRGARALSLTLR